MATMESSELDTPEFNQLLEELLDDLDSGHAENQVTANNDDKTYSLTSTPKYICKKKQKTRVIKTKYLKSRRGLPRLVRTDVRSTYPEMLTVAANIIVFSRILSLLETFCMPDVHFSLKKRLPTTGEWTVIDVNGPTNYANLIFTNLALFPDCTTSLISSRFDPDSGVIVCELQNRFTKLYNFGSAHDLLPGLVVETSHVGQAVSDNKSSGDVVPKNDALSGDQIAHALENLTMNLQVRRKPISVVIGFKMVIQTNEHKRLTELRATQYEIQNDFYVEP